MTPAMNEKKRSGTPIRRTNGIGRLDVALAGSVGRHRTSAWTQPMSAAVKLISTILLGRRQHVSHSIEQACLFEDLNCCASLARAAVNICWVHQCGCENTQQTPLWVISDSES